MTLPRATPPVSSPTCPIRPLPAGACDAHVHIVGNDFPLWKRRVEDPADGTLDDWLVRLRAHLAALGCSRTVIVHSILYGHDNNITLAAAKALGPSLARVVALVPDAAPDRTLRKLADTQTVAVRLNYVHGGVLTWEGACSMAPRLAAHDLHLQMLLHTHQHMIDLADDIRALPVPLVIDHLGWPDLARGVEEPGFQILLQLMQEGHIYVKLSAPYRMAASPYSPAAPFLQALLDANHERCLWGSDWPHLMIGDAAPPDAGELLNQILALASSAQTDAIFRDTPQRLFGF